MSLEGIVDSVTVMKFRHQVRKELGKVIGPAELNEKYQYQSTGTGSRQQKREATHKGFV